MNAGTALALGATGLMGAWWISTHYAPSPSPAKPPAKPPSPGIRFPPGPYGGKPGYTQGDIMNHCSARLIQGSSTSIRFVNPETATQLATTLQYFGIMGRHLTPDFPDLDPKIGVVGVLGAPNVAGATNPLDTIARTQAANWLVIMSTSCFCTPTSEEGWIVACNPALINIADANSSLFAVYSCPPSICG